MKIIGKWKILQKFKSLIYFWTLSENRLNIVPGKKSRFRATLRELKIDYFELHFVEKSQKMRKIQGD